MRLQILLQALVLTGSFIWAQGAQADQKPIAIDKEAYFPAQCEGLIDAKLRGSPSMALRLEILDLSLHENHLRYVFKHAVVQCRMIENKAQWIYKQPIRGSYFVVASFVGRHGFTAAHDYESDRFGGVYISQGKVPLSELLSPKNLQRYRTGQEVAISMSVRVGYNVQFQRNGKVLSVEKSSPYQKTGYFILNLKIQSGQIPEALIFSKK